MTTTKSSRVERFKGVVPQQNGHWGAQIYTNHQRIWLGTFKSEVDAAMAYDSAAIKLRSEDSQRNFPWTSITAQEPSFQSLLTKDAVLNMIKDGSFSSRFADFLRSRQGGAIDEGSKGLSLHRNDDFLCTLLFQKELTPSDVGKLNRLVIPKRYAIKHFPNVPESSEAINTDSEVGNGVQLEFFDSQMNLWKFRYSYWKSSQSFVFTRGWSQFVKEKRLRQQDIIAFYLYESRNGGCWRQPFFMIDVARKNDSENNETKREKDVSLEHPSTGEEEKGFRLFGVQIN